MRSNHGLPRLAAVARAKDQVVRADHITVLRIGEPDVEERLVGPLLLVALRLGEQLLRFLRRRLGRDLAFHRRDQQVVGRAAVELQRHVSPPSAVCRTTPSWPTAQPCLSSTKNTAVRSELTGTCDCFHVAPPSPRHDELSALSHGDQPIAGACVTACSRLCAASGECCAGASSTSTKPAPVAGGASTRRESATAMPSADRDHGRMPS